MAKIELYHEDCMVGMARYPDKYFDLAIVDPPYFKGVANKDYFNSKIKNTRKENLGNIKVWDNGIPDQSWYNELLRVSKNQIIWGANYYEFKQPCGALIWDKVNDNTPFSDCEIASNSLIQSVKIFRYKWNGFLQQDMKKKEKRIHPTQKPTALYKWVLMNYAKPGDKILETHIGSGSIAIACDELNYDLIGFEIDKTYFEAACKRLKQHQSQLKLI